jgi:oligoendopeptidase F
MTESENMSWDLSQLVKVDDPGYIEERMKAAVKEMEDFRNRYRGKVVSLNAKQLYEMLDEVDRLNLEYEGPFVYAQLAYSADMNKDVNKHLFGVFRTSATAFLQSYAFVDLELGALLSKNPDIVNDPAVAEYKHKLERIQREVPHMLSEDVEQAIIAKDENGVKAWSNLQQDWLASRMYEIEIDGEMKTLPYGEIISLYEHPDRDLRKRAHEVVYEGLSKDEIVWSSAIRSVFADHLKMVKMRRWDSPMTQSFIENDMDEETITALMNTIEKNVGEYRRYLKLKAKALGLDVLGNWDIYAPMPTESEKKYTWEEARKLNVDSYMNFDKESGEWMNDMYEKRHMDAVVREGKRSGAFCATWHAGESAYILQSFNGTIGDVYTSAHELGHALHAYLGTRAQKPTNYEIGSCIAECGSNFGELLLTETLLSQMDSMEERKTILGSVLDSFAEGAFQVSTRVWFETAIYEAIEKGKYLDGNAISDLWVEARTKMYDDAVEWLPVMRWWWTFKHHFYMANYRYYNYPYVFAGLFVYAMYKLYKEQGKNFVPKFKAFLAAGSSKSPRELAAEIGFDITTEEFWQKGIDQFSEFIDLFEETL